MILLPDALGNVTNDLGTIVSPMLILNLLWNNQPEIDSSLNPHKYWLCGFQAFLTEDDVNETTLCSTDERFVHDPK